MRELDQLGPRLRAARVKQEWTLDDLAARAGISPSTLSRLESGKRQASLELLLPLTRELGIRIDDLLPQPDRDPRVHREAIAHEGMTIAPLTREESNVRAYKITYHPDAPKRSFQVHEGHEWLYVMSGQLLLELGEQSLTLERGEAAEFDTNTPHRMRASGTRPAEIISIFNAVGERLHLRSHAGEVDNVPTPAQTTAAPPALRR